MESYFIKREISIKDLILWDENARFSDKYFQKTETELIDYFCLSKKFKIIDLAIDIVADFDIPQVEKLIVYENSGGNVSLEGNRRLTVYKLLCNPKLTSNTEIEQKFIELKAKISINDNFKLECLVTRDINKGYHLIERKHTKSNNEVHWGDNERAHHNSRRGKANQSEKLKVAVTNIIKGLDIPEEMKDQVLGPGYVTNFWRILDSSIASNVFGFTIEKDGVLKIGDANFNDKLKVIILNVLQKKDFSDNKIDSRSLNTNKEKEEYLKAIKPEHYEKVKSEIKNNTIKDIFGKTNVNIVKPRKTPITKTDDVIFGKTLSLKSGKVNDLYRAIVEIDEKSKNSESILPISGMVLRLIIEVAARVYYKENGDIKKSKKDQVCEDFIKLAKTHLSQADKNLISLTSDWLTDKDNFATLLDKYAHGNITPTREDILKKSKIVADILEFYFRK